MTHPEKSTNRDTLPSLTRAEFEAAYAKRSDVTVKQLHYYGRFAEPCICDYPDCEGWAMGHQHEDALIENGAAATQ